MSQGITTNFRKKRLNSDITNVPNKLQRNFFTETYHCPIEPYERDHSRAWCFSTVSYWQCLFFRLTPSSLPYLELNRGEDVLEFLIDTGSNENYIQSTRIRNPIPNVKHFYINSVAGNLEITHHAFVDIFGPNTEKLKFYILPTLQTFHGIIGNDTLRKVKAVIHTDRNFMTIAQNIIIPLKQKKKIPIRS